MAKPQVLDSSVSQALSGNSRKRTRSTQKTQSTAQTKPGRMRRGAELFGVLLLSFTLFMLLALISHDPESPKNWVGPVGRFVAFALTGAFGLASYFIVAAFASWSIQFLMGRWPRFSFWMGVHGFLGLSAFSVLVALVAGQGDGAESTAGGLVGDFFTGIGLSALGHAGTSLFATSLLIVSISVFAEISWSRIVQDLSHFFQTEFARMWGHFVIWKDAQNLERTKRKELLLKAREKEAARNVKFQEREKALKDKLSEKRKLARLKAEARAQESIGDYYNQSEKADKFSDDENEIKDENKIVESDPLALIKQTLKQTPLDNAADVLHSMSGEEDEEADLSEEISDIPLIKTQAKSSTPTKTQDATKAQVSTPPQEGLPEFMLVRDDSELQIHERKTIEANFSDTIESATVLPDSVLQAVIERPIDYEMPPLSLLDYEGQAPVPVDEQVLKSKAVRLEEKLRTYGVEGKVTAIRPGPVVTTYEYSPAPGIKVSKIAKLADDIAMSMAAMRVRIVAPIPGKGVVGIELPNDARESVYLKELIAHEGFRKNRSPLALALGKDTEGEAQVRDLRKMPHLLIAGTTGSGKSVSINTMILSILYKATPDQVKFIMVDPKMLELSLYEDIPHLLLPVVTDAKKASLALAWAVDEMERRYQMLSDWKVRNIEGFNQKLEKILEQRRDGASTEENDPCFGKDLPKSLPYIVVLIDEFADLMCVAPRDVEASVQRLAQKARAAGIHVLLATQRPSTDVITGVIKNNFPSRISFRVGSRHDSSTILNGPGAENLLGMGDSLFLSVAAPNPERIHGAFVSETEVERVVEFWKKQAKPNYDPNILKPKEVEGEGDVEPEERDEMYERAIAVVRENKRASISFVQRKLRVGYNRAARMVEMMEVDGIVGPASGPKGEREILNAVGLD